MEYNQKLLGKTEKCGQKPSSQGKRSADHDSYAVK